MERHSTSNRFGLFASLLWILAAALTLLATLATQGQLGLLAWLFVFGMVVSGSPTGRRLGTA